MQTWYPRASVVIQATIEGADPDDLTTTTVEVVPTSVEWTRTPTDETDVARVTLPLRSLALDPRVVRRMVVEVLAADAPPGSWWLQESPRFLGWASDTTAGVDSDRRTISIQCRGYESRLMDARWYGGRLRIDRDLSTILRDIVSRVPGYDRLQLDVDDDARPSTALGRPHLVPDDDWTVWDVAREVASLTGQRAWMDLDTLRVGPVDDLTGEDAAVLTYPGTAHRLQLRRTLGVQETEPIEVRAYDPATGRTTTGVYPRSADRRGVRIPIRGAYAQETVDAMARNAYRQRMRGTVEGDVDVMAMDDGLGVDILALGHRSVVAVDIDPDGDAVPVPGGRQGAIRYLVGLGVDEATAATLVDGWTASRGRRSTMVVQEATHRIDDRGYRGRLRVASVLGLLDPEVSDAR